MTIAGVRGLYAMRNSEDRSCSASGTGAEPHKRFRFLDSDASICSSACSEGDASTKRQKLGLQGLLQDASYCSSADSAGDLTDKIEKMHLSVPLAMIESGKHESILICFWQQHKHQALTLRLEDERVWRGIENEDWQSRLIVKSKDGSKIDLHGTLTESQFPVTVVLRQLSERTRYEGVRSFKSKPEYYENVKLVSGSRRPRTPDCKNRDIPKRSWERQTSEWRGAWRKIDGVFKLTAMNLKKEASEIEKAWAEVRALDEQNAKIAKAMKKEYKRMSHEEHIAKTKDALQHGSVSAMHDRQEMPKACAKKPAAQEKQRAHAFRR